MIINEKTKKLLPIKNLNDLYVVADFDKTITKGSSQSSWGILANSNLVPKDYVSERTSLFNHYRPIEIDETLDFKEKSKEMKDWFQKHINLLIKYKISDEIFKKASKDLSMLEFRKGAKEFIDFLHKNNIPLIIISAGIGNFIEAFLKENNCYFDNVYISSNKIIFKDGIACGAQKDIIHSLNKNEISLPKKIKEKLKDKKQVILLGDQLSDLNMIDYSKHDSIISVGFIVEESQKKSIIDNFGIVSENEDDDYIKLLKLLF